MILGLDISTSITGYTVLDHGGNILTCDHIDLRKEKNFFKKIQIVRKCLENLEAGYSIEQVYIEIKNYGHEDQKKKLIAGIVLTGGGAQLLHLKQLVEYITGMDARIGYPNEHLAGDSDEALSSPSYATAVGLLMEGLDREEIALEESTTEQEIVEPEETITYQPITCTSLSLALALIISKSKNWILCYIGLQK